MCLAERARPRAQRVPPTPTRWIFRDHSCFGRRCARGRVRSAKQQLWREKRLGSAEPSSLTELLRRMNEMSAARLLRHRFSLRRFSPDACEMRKEVCDAPKGRAGSPLRARACNDAFLKRKERRARSEAPYLTQLVHGSAARPILEVEALPMNRLHAESVLECGA